MAPRRTTVATGSFSRGSSDSGRQIKNVVTNLKNILEDLKRNEIKAALKEMGEEIVKETTLLVPVLTGALRDSAKVSVDPKVKNPKVTVSYGNAAVRYAVIVHEDVERRSPEGVGSKFLERGAAIASQRFEEIAAKHIRAKLK